MYFIENTFYSVDRGALTLLKCLDSFDLCACVCARVRPLPFEEVVFDVMQSGGVDKAAERSKNPVGYISSSKHVTAVLLTNRGERL